MNFYPWRKKQYPDPTLQTDLDQKNSSLSISNQYFRYFFSKFKRLIDDHIQTGNLICLHGYD